MNQNLVDHIDMKLHNAGRFVLQYMPLDINIDTAYEAMLACTNNYTLEMFTAFQHAVKFLPPQGNSKTFNMKLADGRSVSVQVRFMPTTKWPSFLIPDGALTINPEGYFAAILDTPIRVATEWERLNYLWTELRGPRFDLEPYIIAYLLPWIRECLADFDPLSVAIDTTRKERGIIEKELAQIMNDWNVTFFPRLSKQLMGIARSGRHLFAQYQMLEAAYTTDNLAQAPIIVTRTPSLVEPWVREQMHEVLDDFQVDRVARAFREADERRAKMLKLDKAKGLT